MRTWITPSRRPAALLAVTLAGLAGGLAAWLAGADELGDRVLALTVVAGSARMAHGGRTTQVWDAEAVNQTTGKTMALFRCTQMILWPRS